MAVDPAFLAAFDALPFGGYGATYRGRRYRITKTQYIGARSQKLTAEELGGTDFLSFNLYRFESGDAILKPCETSAEKVRDFVLNVVAD